MTIWKKKKVKNLNDGDSGFFSDGTQFRLANVQAPEKYQYGGSTAKRRLAGILGRNNNFVNTKTIAIDRYGRKVVEMRNRDGSINNRMQRRGCRNRGR
jgi:endonuclease YncB( thermonuclease family)